MLDISGALLTMINNTKFISEDIIITTFLQNDFTGARPYPSTTLLEEDHKPWKVGG